MIFLIQGQLTVMLLYRIHGFLADGILNSEVVWKFSFYLRVMKTIETQPNHNW